MIPGTYILLDGAALTIDKNVTLVVEERMSSGHIVPTEGDSDDRLATIDAQSRSRHFSITAGNVNFIGIRFINGEARQGGSMLINQLPGETVSLIGCAILNCSATTAHDDVDVDEKSNRGGGVSIEYGRLLVVTCLFAHCNTWGHSFWAKNSGGALSVGTRHRDRSKAWVAFVDLRGSSIRDCHAVGPEEALSTM